MIKSVLTVCTANICRSPVAEAALAALLPDVRVSSAGLHGIVGHDVDKDSRAAAEHFGVKIGTHSARKFTQDIGREADLILVLDKGHLDDMRRKFPQFSGKTFLLRHFSKDGDDVPDPYKNGVSAHLRAVELILDAASEWAEKIKGMS